MVKKLRKRTYYRFVWSLLHQRIYAISVPNTQDVYKQLDMYSRRAANLSCFVTPVNTDDNWEPRKTSHDEGNHKGCPYKRDDCT